MAGGSPSNGFLEWLASQWFFLLALVSGATHAAQAQAKINRHETQLDRLDRVNERIAVIENNVAWIKEHLEKHPH
jgi:hypothetical protein